MTFPNILLFFLLSSKPRFSLFFFASYSKFHNSDFEISTLITGNLFYFNAPFSPPSVPSLILTVRWRCFTPHTNFFSGILGYPYHTITYDRDLISLTPLGGFDRSFFLCNWEHIRTRCLGCMVRVWWGMFKSFVFCVFPWLSGEILLVSLNRISDRPSVTLGVQRRSNIYWTIQHSAAPRVWTSSIVHEVSRMHSLHPVHARWSCFTNYEYVPTASFVLEHP